MQKPKQDILTDEAVALKVQQNDKESFGVLVERYEAKLTRYGKKFMSNGADIEDKVQEVFMKAYTNIRSFNAEMKFSPWIYRIAHNEFVNALKKQSFLSLNLFEFDTLFPHLYAKETADQDANDRDTKAMFDECLDEVDARYREPLVLHYYEELSYQEIAEVMRIPISTVGVRISRGKVNLRKVFKKKYPNHE